MTNTKRHAIGILTALIGLHVSTVAAGRESEQRAALNRKSLQSGLGAGAVALLRRLPGPGAETVAQRLTTEFAERQRLGGAVVLQQGEGRVDATVGTARFRVDDDGTRIRYDNRATVDNGKYERVSVEKRLSHDQLVDLGLKFIAGPISPYVKLGRGDEIVPLKSEYEVEGGVDQHGKRDEDKVVAATIVFGRTVNGIHVVGSGSKISVTFGNDTSILGFRVDWPQYASTAQHQQVLSTHEIWERVSALSSMHFGADDVKVERFECGYFDNGARADRDKNAFVQAACSVHYVGRKNVQHEGRTESLVTAIADQIPVGVVVEPDAAWPHATALLTRGDVCAVSEMWSSVESPPAAP